MLRNQQEGMSFQ